MLPNVPAAVSASRFTPPKLSLVGYGKVGRAGPGQDQLDAIAAGARAEVLAELDAAFAEAERAKVRAERAAAALLDAVDQLEKAERVTLGDLREQAVALGLAFAEAVLNREIRSFDDVVLDTARAALELAPQQGKVTLTVNPDDFAAVTEKFGASGTITVAQDRSVSAGGAVVRQGPLVVDADVAAALDRVRAALS